MSQRAVLRGFILCILPLLVGLPADAQVPVTGLTISPGQVEVIQGGTSELLTAQVTAYPGQAPIAGKLVFEGLPTGVTPSPSPVEFTVPASPYGTANFPVTVTVPFRLTALPGATPGTYSDITVWADPFELSTGLTVVVVPYVPPSTGSIGINVSSYSMEVCPGREPVPAIVTVTPQGGYTGTPVVSFGLLPPGIVVEPNTIDMPPLPPAASAPFTVSALPGTAPGTYKLRAMVIDGSGRAKGSSVPFDVVVPPPDFTPSLSPAQLVLGPGAYPGTVLAGLRQGRCSSPTTVTVTPSGLPAGVSVSPESAVLAGPGYAPAPFVFTAAAGAPQGSATVRFTFVPSEGATFTASLPVTVRPLGSLAASAAKDRVDLCPGQGFQQNSVSVSGLDGYQGSPVLTFPELPPGIVVSQEEIPLPQVPPTRVVTFGVSAENGTSPGVRTVRVLVTDPNGPTATTSFTVDVRPPDFTAVFSPPSLPLNAGGAPASLKVGLSAGSCPPTTPIAVAPTGLPAGVTVTPASAELPWPGFAPATFSVQAASTVPPGPLTVTFSLVPAGGSATTAGAPLVVCGPPPPPTSPRVAPRGDPQGPVTATDFLALSWAPPASPFPATRYEWRINGEPWTPAAGTEASAPPRGRIDPVQLFVRAWSCQPEAGPGAEASSPVYPLGPPVADFVPPPVASVGVPATFTDASSPQATSWLWFLGDGAPALTAQSPTVTFTSGGPKVVVLVATNGSGSSTVTKTVNVFPPLGLRAAGGSVTRAFDPQADGRLALARVEVAPGTTLRLRRLEGSGEAVVFLRLLDADGRVAVERRLVLAEGEEARHDLSAWGPTGPYRVELVGPEGLDASVEAAGAPGREPERPVSPRRSGEVR